MLLNERGQIHEENSKMNNTNLRHELERIASKYLETPFTLSDYRLEEGKATQYIANGVIARHSVPANVEVTFDQASREPRYWMITDDDIPMTVKHIGTIELGKDICVTDPCYDRDTWCATELHNTKPGLWDVHASIDEIDCWGQRTYLLELVHQSVTEEQLEGLEWIEHSCLGVDSGQMSVFDDAYYRRKNGSVEKFNQDHQCINAFYDCCCKLSEDHVGIYYAGDAPVGVVCSSGCGDGSYPLFIKEIDFKVVAMKISFA